MTTIGVAAAQIGVSTSALRKWESRYGLPTPQRVQGGARRYTAADVSRLQDIKRRIDLGHKPAEVLHTVLLTEAVDGAANVAATAGAGARPADAPCCATVLGLLRTQGANACHRWLHDQRHQLGAQAFVEGVAAPLMEAVGHGWAHAEVAVYEEHCLANLLQSVLTVPPGVAQGGKGHSTCLLATLSGEWHTLGLTMLHAVLREAGIACTNLGASVPNADLVAAARSLGARVVAVSLSEATAPRGALKQLQLLRQALSAEVALWVGGAGVGKLARLPAGVQAVGGCGQARDAISATWPDAKTKVTGVNFLEQTA